jgi:serine/threonine protein kinase
MGDLNARIGPYRLLRVLGQGGMGVVYQAEQLEPVRREVAVKLIHAGADGLDVVVRRFESERQALAVMEHPSIARVFDGGVTDDGRPYFVMELVRGVPLLDELGVRY